MEKLGYKDWSKEQKITFVLTQGRNIATYLDGFGGHHWQFIPESERNDYNNQDMHMHLILGAKGATEYQLNIRVDEYKERLEVSGSYARGKNDYYNPRFDDVYKDEGVSVSMNRPALDIAKEINRRCLPAYYKNMLWSIETRDTWDEYKRNKQATVDELNEVLGDKKGQDKVYTYWRNGEAILKIEARANSQNSIDLRIDGITKADTLQIIEVIRANHPQQEKEDQTIHRS